MTELTLLGALPPGGGLSLKIFGSGNHDIIIIIIITLHFCCQFKESAKPVGKTVPASVPA